MRKLTDKENKSFIDGMGHHILRKREQQEGFKLLILGVLVGIMGGFIANLFYRISENFRREVFLLINLLIILIFLVLVIGMGIKSCSYFKEIREFEGYRDKIFKRGLMIDSAEPLL